MPRKRPLWSPGSTWKRKSKTRYIDDDDDDGSESDDCGVSSSDDPDFVLEEEVAPASQPTVVDVSDSSDADQPAEEDAVGSQMRVQDAEVRPKGVSKNGDEKEELDWVVWQKENARWISEFLKEDEENSKLDELPLEEVADPSPDVILPLLRFQKEWLFWALKQEASQARGGILADEMGMGKTIQAITLVLTARSLRKQCSVPSVNIGPCSSSSLLPRIGCTLVVCPVVAVIQWVGEIERYTEKGSARVLVYHGANRGKMKYNFDDYDFVITTYSIIESEFRRYMMPPKEKCKWCGKLFHARKLQVHLKYFCGPTACRTEKQAKQTRKNKKQNSIKDKSNSVKGAKTDIPDLNVPYDEFSVCSHDKDKGKRKAEHDAPIDNVADSSEGKSILHSVRWERIILDEAHFIKDRQCNTAKAIFALESEYKWALSGTPLQNRVGELYSLVRFLQINPFSYFLCKDCNCKILDRGTAKKCNACPHSIVRHFCWWNKNISTPIQKYSNSDEGRNAMILLKKRVLKSIVLRRTKEGRAADLALPPRIVYLRRNTLDKNENEFYEALYTQSRVQFDTYAVAGTLMNNYAHIFDLLTRLRQAVDHPYLVVYSKTADALNGSKDNAANLVCGVCHEPAEDVVVSSCDHSFCKSCLIDISATMRNMTCPTCSKPLTVDFTTNKFGEEMSRAVIKGYKSGILNRINKNEAFQTSTKIEALKEEIRNMLEADGSAKGIVFSQFTSFLDLIHFSLQKSGVKCVQLVGSMTLAERDKAIKSFTEDGDCKIFLMSLKAGGVALNLTVASHVYMMDPWWNPAVERQAQDRIHRIGQYKPIRIVRFVIEGTIEDRVLKLQEKKELVFQGTLENSAEALAKLTEADLQFLFQS